MGWLITVSLQGRGHAAQKGVGLEDHKVRLVVNWWIRRRISALGSMALESLYHPA